MAGTIGDEAGSSSTGKYNSIGESVVVDVGNRRRSCDYCKSGARSSTFYCLGARSLTVDDYQDLLDRGWRRSGSFLYKPEMEKICCPSYAIRLKAGDFVPSKEQNRVSRRMQRFLDGILDGKNTAILKDGSSSSKSADKNTISSAVKDKISSNSEEKSKEEEYLQILSNKIDNVVHEWVESGKFPSDIEIPKASVKKITRTKKMRIEDFEDLLYSSNISFQIAAALKRSKMVDNATLEVGLSRQAAGSNGQCSAISPITIAEKLEASLNQEGSLSDLTVKACKGHLNFCSAVKHACSSESTGIGNSIQPSRSDGSKASCPVKKSESPQLKKRKLEIRLKRSSFDPQEYALYRKYQIRVHNDTLEHDMENSYKSFLVDTPIVFVPPTGDNMVPPCGFGSFHQQYLIDGRLVAVGVVDILPRCLSSKYLFWDPDLAFLSLGKYSAIQEISWIKENQVHCPSLQYYYLGYYIHSCSKMRYKAAYRPSELLCPLRYMWVFFDNARPLLDKSPYAILSDFSNFQNEESSQEVVGNHIEPQCPDPGDDLTEPLSDEHEEMMELDYECSEDDSDTETSDSTSDMLSEDEIKDVDLSNILMGLNNTRMRFKDLQQTLGSMESNYLELQLLRYVKAVGPGPSQRMVYIPDILRGKLV